DQWKELETYTSESTDLMMSINEFMKSRAEIEANYAHQIQKLVKPHKDEIAKKSAKGGLSSKILMESSLGKAWVQILNEADNVATIHFGTSDKINTELRKTIKYQSQDNEKKFKEKFDKIRKATAELQAQVVAMEKLHDKFEYEKKNMEAAKAYHLKVSANKNSTQKEIETAKYDAEKKAIAASDAMAFYQKSIVETNEKKTKHFTAVLPAILNEVQTDNENFCIRATKVALMRYFELFSTIVPMYIQGHEELSTVFQEVNADRDSELVVSMLKLDEEFPPADYTFEEKAVEYICMFFQTSSLTGRILSLPEMQTLSDDDDSILAQPPKKARKLAADRVKAFEKDIAESEKKKQAVESLLAVCAAKASPDPKQVSELTFQKETLEVKLSNWGLRKHKLQSFIASVDKAAPPELPAHLSGKTVQPIVTSPVSYSAGPVLSSPTSNEGKFASSPSNATAPSATAATPGSVDAHSTTAVSGSETSAWGGNGGSNLGGIKKVGKMIYDFQAAPNSQEISANIGDDVEVLEEQDDGWWKVRVFSSGEWKEGLVPG
ncbi:hypothetical protein BDR26DRAFT_805634, partial [Obelidium mucronatum]